MTEANATTVELLSTGGVLDGHGPILGLLMSIVSLAASYSKNIEYIPRREVAWAFHHLLDREVWIVNSIFPLSLVEAETKEHQLLSTVDTSANHCDVKSSFTYWTSLLYFVTYKEVVYKCIRTQCAPCEVQHAQCNVNCDVCSSWNWRWMHNYYLLHFPSVLSSRACWKFTVRIIRFTHVM